MKEGFKNKKDIDFLIDYFGDKNIIYIDRSRKQQYEFWKKNYRNFN